MYTLKILFIGSNPSQRSKSVVAFWNDTKSNKVLSSWTSKLYDDPNFSIESLHYLNVSNSPTPGNRPLKASEIKENLPGLRSRIEEVCPDKIVVLGKTAEKALTLLGFNFYAMPHPSGLNRQLNDPKFVEEKINGLRVYLSPQGGQAL
jgi:uracil-DNA glycosylase